MFLLFLFCTYYIVCIFRVISCYDKKYDKVRGLEFFLSLHETIEQKIHTSWISYNFIMMNTCPLASVLIMLQCGVVHAFAYNVYGGYKDGGYNVGYLGLWLAFYVQGWSPFVSSYMPTFSLWFLPLFFIFLLK